MATVTLLTTTGNVLMRDASAEVRILHCVDGVERFIGQSAKLVTGKVTHLGAAQFSSSIRGKSREAGGSCVKQSFSIEEGQIFKVFVKINNGYGSMPKIGCFYIKVRAAAAYRTAKMNTFEFLNIDFKAATIEGNFDVLTLEEADADGIKTAGTYRRLFSQENVGKVLTSCTALFPESAPVVKKKLVRLVDEDTGNTTTVVRLRKKRAIEV